MSSSKLELIDTFLSWNPKYQNYLEIAWGSWVTSFKNASIFLENLQRFTVYLRKLENKSMHQNKQLLIECCKETNKFITVFSLSASDTVLILETGYAISYAGLLIQYSIKLKINVKESMCLKL